MISVKCLMNAEVNLVSPSHSIIEVARLMKESGVDVIAVCQDGEFRGAVIEKDLTGMLDSFDQYMKPASLVMSKCPPVISPEEDIMEAAAVMIVAGVRTLPVVQAGRLIGLFTVDDLARESRDAASLVLKRISTDSVQNRLVEA